MSQKRIIHYYGLSPERYGLSDEEFIDHLSSRAHGWNECLRRLSREHGFLFEIHLLTCEKKEKIIEKKDIKFVFHPLLLRFIPSFRVGGYSTGYVTDFSPFFLRKLKRNPPSLFVFYGVNSLSSWPAARILEKEGVPFLTLVHGLRPPRFFLTCRLFSKSSGIIVPTSLTARYVKDRFEVDRARLFTIPSGINSELFRPGEKTSSYPFLLFVGRLERNKGFLELLSLLDEIKKGFPGMKLGVAGRFVEKSYREKTLALIKRKGLEENVLFYGEVPSSKMVRLYQKAHLLLSFSRRESFGRAVVEAMMCGTPAAGLAGSGGPTTVIKKGKSGILSSKKRFGKEVVELLRERERLQQMSRRAEAEAEENYSIKAVYPRVEKVYLSALENETFKL